MAPKAKMWTKFAGVPIEQMDKTMNPPRNYSVMIYSRNLLFYKQNKKRILER
ncbi:hypothetical protein Gotri_011534 [Gossypium trilobum]|uniref:Uncharacterized protein n=1 Tax=Gossypium trilobum TaxID=34281 RepID=A0A7J9EUJ4_9ROSI|nr:hypothetical protein [Gossypium trilobum]